MILFFPSTDTDTSPQPVRHLGIIHHCPALVLNERGRSSSIDQRQIKTKKTYNLWNSKQRGNYFIIGVYHLKLYMKTPTLMNYDLEIIKKQSRQDFSIGFLQFCFSVSGAECNQIFDLKYNKNNFWNVTPQYIAFSL